MTPLVHNHLGYWRGCRCPSCRTGYAAYKRAFRWGVSVDELPELETVDDIAVERACRGDQSVPLSRQEMAAALARLDGKGWSLNEIAYVLGVSQRTVVRWRTGQTVLPQRRLGSQAVA